MNFERCIISIKKELLLKYPILKKEFLKVNSSERRLELINRVQLIVRKIMESVANGLPPVFKTICVKWENCAFDERELYYENLKIFKTQKQVDNGMKEICYLLNAPSWELRILATSKGIVAGPVVFTLANGESIDCGKNGGVCIPQNVLEIEKMSSSATWVLVVEKDASFQKLISADASRRLGSCILITGKGFPDLNSRILVCKLWELLRIPVLVLVDADPHGFEIMCVYRFGSLSMVPYSKYLACPAVRWLGVHPSDIRPLRLETKVLSPVEGKKIHSLFKRPYVDQNKNLKTELEILLEGNVKAEIEGVANISTNYLTDVYMRKKIECKEYF